MSASEAPERVDDGDPGMWSSSACLLAALNAIPDDTIAPSEVQVEVVEARSVSRASAERAGKRLGRCSSPATCSRVTSRHSAAGVEALIVAQHHRAAAVQGRGGHAERGRVHPR